MSQALAEKIVGQQAELRRLTINSITVVTSTAGQPQNHATIRAAIDSNPAGVYHGDGVGPIDAICKALEEFEPGFVVAQWTGKSEGEGSATIGVINVLIRCTDGKTYSGLGRHPNTMQATVEAVADALNKHFYHVHKNPRPKV